MITSPRLSHKSQALKHRTLSGSAAAPFPVSCETWSVQFSFPRCQVINNSPNKMSFKEHRKTLYIILGQILLSNRGDKKAVISTSKTRNSFSGILSHFCGSPGSPEGGRVILPGPPDDGLSKVYDVGTVVRYDCDKNRVIFGARVRECLQSGSWSDSIPICSRLC